MDMVDGITVGTMVIIMVGIMAGMDTITVHRPGVMVMIIIHLPIMYIMVQEKPEL